MRSKLSLTALVFMGCIVGGCIVGAAGAQISKPDAHTLRVCADPDNLPMSNDKREGFDNKIAELIAKDLGDSIAFTWWPTRRGFVRNTLRAGECDVIFGVPTGYDLVAASSPYYRSTYFIVTRHDRDLKLTSLDDPRMKQLKVGVNTLGENYTNTPPAEALAQRGVSEHVVWFSTFYDTEHRPSDIVNAVANGTIDAALVWGPMAGYFAKHATVPLDIVALPDTDAVTHLPLAYDQALGLRRGERDRMAKLNDVLSRRKSDIDAILHEYGVPTLTMTQASSSK
jgi:mxaJ protein